MSDFRKKLAAVAKAELARTTRRGISLFDLLKDAMEHNHTILELCLTEIDRLEKEVLARDTTISLLPEIIRVTLKQSIAKATAEPNVCPSCNTYPSDNGGDCEGCQALKNTKAYIKAEPE